jgi:hypothetical protein
MTVLCAVCFEAIAAPGSRRCETCSAASADPRHGKSKSRRGISTAGRAALGADLTADLLAAIDADAP